MVAMRESDASNMKLLRWLTKKIDYGFNGQKFYGQNLEIEIQSFTTSTPHKEKERI